ncbi:uncharacterized protein SETTUDRAFT_133214 [Exserohilum turcica Et28A]|uniref:Uncharacterized protein n=1 Tax=Exserohilum turcicum (strain 28A) TaxID=671987 RepID=R0KUV4_EXST2|nr:uncharacterized protein SETTUDRAFT_133214 [Exserohilum turcica Et28A]EOA91547.1 hypothetical protein SETTUDRAFT_133214 [Exserohilum turcica Et28A]
MFGNVFGTPVHSDYSSGAKCATNSGSNCVCPLGTDYSESATWAVVGAPVSDVEALMNDFHKPAWRGSLPYKTEGPNNRPGMSKRTSTYKTLLGIFNFTEILTKWEKKPNGSFIQKLEYLEAVGNLTSNPWGGYWITITGDYVFGDQTLIQWSTYLCSRGVVNDWAKLHEASFRNVIDILRPKTTGFNVAPFSVPPAFS